MGNPITTLRKAMNAGRQGTNLQPGIVAGLFQGRVTVTVSGSTYTSDTGLSGLKIGDQVWVLVEKGVARIIGTLGPTDGSPL